MSLVAVLVPRKKVLMYVVLIFKESQDEKTIVLNLSGLQQFILFSFQAKILINCLISYMAMVWFVDFKFD